MWYDPRPTSFSVRLAASPAAKNLSRESQDSPCFGSRPRQAGLSRTLTLATCSVAPALAKYLQVQCSEASASVGRNPITLSSSP